MVRIFGFTGSRRRRRYQLAAIFSVTVLLAGFAALPAQAVHDTGRFQLDGDAATGTNTAGTPAADDDWDKVCYEVAVKPVAEGGGGLSPAAATAKCGIGTPTTGATETAWTAEPDRAASIFVGGGSKDPQDLNQWAWKDAGGLPDKDNLEHSFAARYSLPPSTHCPSGTALTCELLYAGLDRFDNSGDAQNGVWFFQSKVTLGTNKVGGATGFSGLHTTNDVLVVSDFSNGGTISTITVYTWDPGCTATNKPFPYCADANLHLQATSTDANCASLTPPGDVGDKFCGLVNPTAITMPWSFTDKSGTPANGALNGEFYEEGINLSLLGLAGACFSSVLTETRSSTSTTATLKDFVLGQLGKCVPNLTTQVQKDGVNFNGTVQPGTPVYDTATITVTGAATPDDATGTVDFFLCGPNASTPPDCSTGGTDAGADKTLVDTSVPPNTKDGISGASSDNVNTAANPLLPGFYCFRAEATLTNYASPDPATNITTECFRVAQLATSIVTDPQSPSGTDNTGPFALADNTLVYDHAVVTGDSADGFPTGTVTFFICNPNQVTGSSGSEVCADGDGTQVGSPVSTTNITGSSPPQTEATSDAVTANQLGVWCFRATYASTNPVYTGSSGDGHRECFTVTTTSSGASAQNWLPNDHVVVSTATGTLAGTLSIELLSGSCDPAVGTVVYTEPVPNSGAFTATAAGATYNTTNGSDPATTFKVDNDNQGTYYWRIVFTPDSPFAMGFTKCETSTVTINDNP